MAYRIVTEAEAKPYREDCSAILEKTCSILREKDFTLQFMLIGSGARNMISRNGNGPYDLDYNIEIINANERYWNDLGLLKETVRKALNKAEGKTFFKDAKSSTSCLTAILHFTDSSDIKFSFDVGIITKNKNGNYMRLIQNKFNPFNQYTWNEIPQSHDVGDKAYKIKKAGQWEKVREEYVRLKNLYLSRQQQDNHPSFIVYVEAVNAIYKKMLYSKNFFKW